MKRCVLKAVYSFLFLGIFFGITATDSFGQNTISGIVFDHNRKPVTDIDVELLDSFERLIGSRKTRGGGFYTFQRLSRGIYYIRPRVSGTGFKEEKIRIDLGALNTIGGVESRQVDLYLEIDPRRRNETPVNNTVLFAQSVPEESKKSYKSGLNNIEKRKFTEAAKDLKKAIEIFPEYFYALESLGGVYLEQNKYLEAENTYKKAFEVNPKSFRSIFGLAIAQNQLKKKNDAVNSLKKANELEPESINSHLLLGIVQRDLSQYSEAEKNLLKAKLISRNKEPDVNWQLAALYYFNMKKPNEAAKELDSYLKNLSKTEKKNNPKKIMSVKKLIKRIRSEANKKS